MVSTQDLAILAFLAALGAAYLLYGGSAKPKSTDAFANGGAKTPDGGSAGRDFVKAMEKAVSVVPLARALARATPRTS